MKEIQLNEIAIFQGLSKRALADLQAVSRQITYRKGNLVCGDSMLFSITEMDLHVAMPSHNHVHEQGGVVLKGALKIWIGNEERLLKSGDAFMIPSNVMHSAETGDVSACVINVFSPVREDYKH